tara:strand:+ start:7650 stop:8555 length:906 start_codon:yes stop_codon:yes gene_type:complete
MDTNLTSYYQKRLDELSSDTESQMEYMLAAAPYIDKLYSLTETAAPDANFPLAIKVNGKEQELFEDYMEFVEGKPNQQRYVDRNRRWNYCPTCDDEMVDMGSSVMVCTICGLSTSYICGDLTYKEEQEIEKNIVYSYKRENHFNEWISQFQGNESTTIPMEIIEQLRFEFKKQKLKNLKDITHPKVRALLKKLRLNKYYEHVPYIATILNGINPPKMSNVLEAKLRLMFTEIQGPFERNCPEERKNFLSYSYVLYKFCELLGEDKYLPCFPLLKSKEKLKQQDSIWKGIAKDLHWEYIPTI